MNRMSQHRRSPTDADVGLIGRAWLVGLIGAGAIAFAVALGSGVHSMATAKAADTQRASEARANTTDSYALIVDAFLAAAVSNGGVPLRWVDPRPALQCGRHTSVRVNNRALRAGEPVQDGQFELQWYSDGCHPPAAPDARIDGWVKLVVFREDWGFSAMIEPEGLRIARGDYEYAVVKRGGASLVRCGQSRQQVIPGVSEDGEPIAC